MELDMEDSRKQENENQDELVELAEAGLTLDDIMASFEEGADDIVITMELEDDTEIEWRIAGMVEVNGERYVALERDVDDENAERTFAKLNVDENGIITLDNVEEDQVELLDQAYRGAENDADSMRIDVFEVPDENGTPMELRLTRVFEVDGQQYAMLTDENDNGEGMIYYYHYMENEDGDPMIAEIESDEEFDRVDAAFDKLMKKL